MFYYGILRRVMGCLIRLRNFTRDGNIQARFKIEVDFFVPVELKIISFKVKIHF